MPNSFDRPRGGIHFLMVVLLLLGTTGVASAEMLAYTLRPDPDEGVLQVELRWETSARTRSYLAVSPRWGNIQDVSALLRGVRCEGGTLAQRGSKFAVRHGRNATLRLRYTVEPGKREFAWDTTYYPITTERFFCGMGNAFLLVPLTGEGLPGSYSVTLRWALPAGWKAACSWGVGPHIGDRVAPADLRHSVYLAGELETKTVERGGLSISVAMVDRFRFDIDAFAAMAASIVAAQNNFMGETRFPPFVVTAIPVGEAVKRGDARLSGSGLYRSFALYVAPRAELTDAVEHLFAHELFHYWNGRILGAEQPEKLCYWFTEGFTDYYALRILFESGYWDAEQYAKWVNRHLREYHRNPAKNVSNARIAADYWKERDTVGEVPYQRGHMLALRWHALAQERGGGSLDQFFKTLVERGRTQGLALTNERIKQAGRELLGSWFTEEFARYVEEAKTVVVPEDALRPALRGDYAFVYEYELGFDRERSLRRSRVEGLVKGSAAARAGLREGDELLGYRIYGEVDKQIELQVLRGETIKTIRYYPRGDRMQVLQFAPA